MSGGVGGLLSNFYRPEMLFFGPGQGTTRFMDDLALREKDLNLAIIGGSNGLLGAGPLLGYQGRICLVMDETALVFDPQGLDRTELEKIAFMGCLASGSSRSRIPPQTKVLLFQAPLARS